MYSLTSNLADFIIRKCGFITNCFLRMWTEAVGRC